MGEKDGRPFRRRIFYVHGFDPRGPGPYHRMFTDHADAASIRWGRTITVSPRKKRGEHVSGWTILAEHNDGRRTETDYEVLRWDDTVRTLWASRGPVKLLSSAFRVLIDYTRVGLMEDMYRPARASFLSVLTPPLMTLVFMLLVAAALVIGSLLGGLFAEAVGLAPLAGKSLVIAGELVVLWLLWRRLSSRTELWWLIRCLDYLREAAGGRADRSEHRAGVFAERIVDAAKDPVTDEIVIVGHSLGALHAVRTVGAALKMARWLGVDGPRVSLVFLGQSIPGYTAYGRDLEFERDLLAVCASEGIQVIDVTSGSDTGSTCRLDVLHGLDAGETAPRHRQERPPFHQVLSRESFRAVRRNPRAYHFQYLLPTERGEGFDYFELVTRPTVITTTRPAG